MVNSEKKIEKMSKGWEDISHEEENPYRIVGRPSNSKQWESLIKNIKDNLELNNNKRINEMNVLDVGCGNGEILFDIFGNQASIHGIDFSENMVKLCQEKNVNGIFHKGESNKIPFGNGMFDIVICYSIFHYFPNNIYVKETIDELLRVCKSEGKILIGDIPDIEKMNLLVPSIWNSPYKLIRKRLASFFKNYFTAENSYRHIEDPKNWKWYDLNHLMNDIKYLGHDVSISKQPSSLLASNHRKDIIVIKN